MFDPLYSEDLPPAPPAPRGWTGTAWLVILLVTAAVVVFQLWRKDADAEDGQDSVSTTLMTMQGRYLVGAATLPGSSSQTLYEQAQTLDTGPVEQRLRFVVLAGELAGPQEALDQLDDLRDKLARRPMEPTDTQQSLLTSLFEVYVDYGAEQFDAPSLDAEKKAQLRRELGWFGELALAPKQSPDAAARQDVMKAAHHTVVAMLVIVLAILGGLLFGFVGAVIFVILLAMRTLRGGLGGAQPDAGIYAETFALWMLLFIGLNLVSAVLPLGDFRLLASGIASLLSLTVLAWPVWRGIPWQRVREDIGWTGGRLGALEVVFGPICYIITFPLVLVAVVVVLILAVGWSVLTGAGPPGDSFAPQGPPAHPIVDVVARTGWWGWVQVFLLAAVIAPIVEETMFRGVLYRQARESTGALGPMLSVMISGTVVSFIFAVIHPQGLLAVPLLMALAYGFTIAREWRDTLLPAMVAHGINNGVVTVFLIVVLGN